MKEIMSQFGNHFDDEILNRCLILLLLIYARILRTWWEGNSGEQLVTDVLIPVRRGT